MKTARLVACVPFFALASLFVAALAPLLVVAWAWAAVGMLILKGPKAFSGHTGILKDPADWWKEGE